MTKIRTILAMLFAVIAANACSSILHGRQNQRRLRHHHRWRASQDFRPENIGRASQNPRPDRGWNQ